MAEVVFNSQDTQDNEEISRIDFYLLILDILAIPCIL